MDKKEKDVVAKEEIKKPYTHVFEFEKVFTEEFFKDEKQWLDTLSLSIGTNETSAEMQEMFANKLTELEKRTNKKMDKGARKTVEMMQGKFIRFWNYMFEQRKIGIFTMLKILDKIRGFDEKYYIDSSIKDVYEADMKAFCQGVIKGEIEKVDNTEEVKEEESKIIM